jgi:hypothetical protein
VKLSITFEAQVESSTPTVERETILNHLEQDSARSITNTTGKNGEVRDGVRHPANRNVVCEAHLAVEREQDDHDGQHVGARGLRRGEPPWAPAVAVLGRVGLAEDGTHASPGLRPFGDVEHRSVEAAGQGTGGGRAQLIVDMRTEAVMSESRDRCGVDPVRSGARRDVLETDLACGNQALAVVGDPHLPQLLRPALLDRTRVNRDPSLGHGAEEVGVVVDPDGNLIVLLRGGRRTDARRGFDRGGVHAPMDESPWLVMLGTEVDPARDV